MTSAEMETKDQERKEVSAVEPGASTQDSFTQEQEQEQEQEDMQANAIPTLAVKIALPLLSMYSQESGDDKWMLLPNVSITESFGALRQYLTELVDSCMHTCYAFKLLHMVDQDNNQLPVNEFCLDDTELSAFFGPNIVALVIRMEVLDYNCKSVRLQVKKTRDLLESPPFNKASILSSSVDDSEMKVEPITVEAKESVEEGPKLPNVQDIFKAFSIGDFYKETLLRTGTPDSFFHECSRPTDIIKSISPSGWNPVPPHRKVMGDLWYLEVVTTDGTFHVTCVAKGFYVNKSNRVQFDPSPASVPHFSHNLLSLLLSVCGSLRTIWTKISERYSKSKVPVGDNKAFPGALDPIATLYDEGKSSLIYQSPQWLAAPASLVGHHEKILPHKFDTYRAQHELISEALGTEDLGVAREWNEEIQGVRSLAATDVNDKIIKQKLEHKVITEYTEACRAGALSIAEGLIAPLGGMPSIPVERTESSGESKDVSESQSSDAVDDSSSQIFVFNGIFFSKAIDSKDVYKLCNGDEACRKSAGRDICNHKLIQSELNRAQDEAQAKDAENADKNKPPSSVGNILPAATTPPMLHTVLCTVVDYKGERFLGQSIIPGVLSQGRNSTRLMYGALDKGGDITVKGATLEKMKTLYSRFHIPARTIAKTPFKKVEVTAEPTSQPDAAEDVDQQPASIRVDKVDDVDEVVPGGIPHAGPLECKVLLGSDGRDYLLEIMRLTPRDANYVKGSKGTQNVNTAVLDGVNNEICFTYVLRQELIDSYLQKRVKEAKDKVIEKGLQERNQIVERTQPISGEGEEKKEDLKLSEEQKNLFEELSTRLEKELEEVATEARKIDLNPNCFVDHFDCDLNGSVAQADESVAKDLANYLWNELIPAVVSNVRERIIEPRDNSTLIGILHANGINVRYLGRITQIVQGEEEIDSELTTKGEHRAAAMPLYCQELLVIEMIARGVKHLLNKYYRTNRGVYEAPAKTIAMLLNHIFQQITPKSTKDNNGGTASNSNAKESKSKSKNKKKVSSTGTAVQTASSILEICLVDATVDTDSCLSSLRAIIFEKYGCYINFSVDHQAVAAVPTVTRDFLINRITPKTLLRRVCQLSGISIVPRSYDFASSAIFDISDIVGLQPIVKSCVRESISNEYELAMKVAMQLLQNNNLAAAFEYTQEAANIIHQITGPLHNSNITANQLLGEILSAVGDDGAATFAFSKSLVIAVQMGGLDGEATIQLHMLLARTLLRQKKAEQSLQHLLSAKYILELIGGVRHVALSELYEMLSQVYEYLGEVETTMQCLKQAQECTGDFVRRCQLQFGIAMRMVRFGQFFEGLEVHKETYRLISKVLPETDPRVVEAKQTLEFYMRSAVEVKEKRNAMQQAEYEMALTQALAAAQEQAAAREAARNKNKTITPDDPSHLEALKLSEAAAEELMAEEDWQTSGDKKKKTSKKNKKK